MLPLVEDAVLRANPEFATLYSTLTSAILNPNGSTKNDPASKERDAIRERLKTWRLKAAKEHLLIHALSTVAPPKEDTKPQTRRAKGPSESSLNTSLPPELVDLLLLLPPLLNPCPGSDGEGPSDGGTPLSNLQSALPLLLTSPPLSSLPALLPQLTALLSRSLHSSALLLARHTNPTTNSSYLHRHVPALPSSAAQAQAAAAASSSSSSSSSTPSADARRQAASSLLASLAASAAALTRLLRCLEAKHGAAARSLELRAAEVALEARRGRDASASALAAARQAVYTPEARAALAGYAAHLRDGRLRLAEEVRSRRAELGGYGVVVSAGGDGEGGAGASDGEYGAGEGQVAEGPGRGGKGKERTMREMARVYRDMGRQVDDARRDLDRLGRT